MWVGLADPGQLLHDLRERPVRDPLTVGEASTLADPGAIPDAGKQFRDESCLADARIADHAGQNADAPFARPVERFEQSGELGLSSHHREVGSSGWLVSPVTETRR